jgi:hypothetical protein
MTWPYVSDRDLGHGQYEGDARLVVWMLGWANHAVAEGLPFFRSNLFFPAPETLRYNEHLFGLSLFTLPLTLAGVPGGLAFAFSFYVMLHAHSHLHLVWLWGIPLSLLLLERWFDRPALAAALAWAAVLTLQLLTSWYLAVVAVVATGVQAVVLVATAGRQASAGVGLVELVRRGAAAGRAWVLGGLTAAGFLLSLGPSPPLLGGSMLAPYAWLSALPGIEGMRAPARFAVLVTLGLGGLAAIGAERLRRSGRAWGRAAVVAAIPLMAVEWFVVDFPAGPPRPLAIPAVYRSAEIASARATLSLPDTFGTPEWYQDADYAYFSTAHWRPIVNGFGRDAPPGHADLVDIARRFPATAPTLRAFGVQYVVVHVGRYPRPDDAPVAAALRAPSVRLVRQVGTDYLFELVD